MRLAGRVAVITGAASGIGRATALRFSEEGASVAIFDRDSGRGEEVLQQIRKRGQSAFFLPVDVAIETQVKQAVGKTIAEFGGLHILVNNAAAFVFGSHDVTEADWTRFSPSTSRAPRFARNMPPRPWSEQAAGPSSM
jgi:NAD(P)-dependent dehydrogenase (short-subunit alcohol dehydrogenase family)